MCLEISTLHHPDLEPLVAEEDIEVVKFLKRKEGKGKQHTLMTPHTKTPIEFDKNNECVMMSRIFKHWHWFERRWCVNEGIHAYTKEVSPGFFTGYALMHSSPFDCYIPKGTKYYMGENNDIVAEKMIIKNEMYEEEQR